MWFTGQMAAEIGSSLVGSAGAVQLLAVLRDGHPRTRLEIVESTGWARRTVENRLVELQRAGLIREAEVQRTGGRPSSSFTLVADARIVLAADLGHTHASVALTDLRGDVLVSERQDLDIERGPQDVIAHVLSRAESLLEQVRRNVSDVAAVCVGLPSPVDHLSGRALNPMAMHGWSDDDLRARIGAVFPVPVLVDNDVNLMAFGERAREHPGAKDLVFVKVATGIGAGVIAGGRLQRGSRGFAGDIGHIPLGGSDRPCQCGNVGCVAVTAALPGIADALRSGRADVGSDADVLALSRAGDPAVLHALRHAGREVGEVLVSVVGILNPSHLVIGGPWGIGLDQLIAGVRETVYGRGFALATQHLRIEASRTGEMAAIHGAAGIAIDAAMGVLD